MTRTEICQHPFPALQAPATERDTTGAAFFFSRPICFLIYKGRAFSLPHRSLVNHDSFSMRDQYNWETTTAPNDASYGPEVRVLPARHSRIGQPGGGRQTATRIV